MANPEKISQEQESTAQRTLSRSVGKLLSASQSDVSKKPGLSASFCENISSAEKALEYCSKAMEALSTEYVQALEEYRTSRDAEKALTALNTAEELWQRETETIAKYDGEGTEKAFLKKIRVQALIVMETKLQKASDMCARRPSDMNIALCLGTLGTIDKALDELGYSESSHERKRISAMAKRFK
jgi:hypothetical protein